MANREEFCNAVTDIWKNHGVYLWGGNGEYTEKQAAQKEKYRKALEDRRSASIF